LEECPLCRLVKGKGIITRLYRQDHICMIVDCMNCHIPMVVFKHHREWDAEEVDHCMHMAAEEFGPKSFQLRWTRARVPAHPHFHVILEH